MSLPASLLPGEDSPAQTSQAPAVRRRLRVLTIASHPVQYHDPLFRRLAARPELDSQVAYCSLRGAEAGHDPELGITVKWDIPMLEGYSWTHVPNRGTGSESFFGLYNPGLWDLIRQGNFDAVACFTGYVRASFWITYLAARSCGAAFIFGCDQGSLEPRDGRRWKRMIKQLGWPLLYRLADQIMASSTRAKELIKSLGIPEERISLTPLPADNDWWSGRASAVDRAAVRKSWNATEADVVLLFCAKLQPWKRPSDLLRAFAKLDQTNTLLVFAGDGPLRPQLQAEAVSLGVASRVRFLGFSNQSELPAIYKSADLMVLPSEYEPFGVVVNEAMCCGCPVMVSDRVGAGPDLVAPVEAELIFRCGDVDALSRRLSNLIAEPGRLREMGQRGALHMQMWSPERNVDATVEAFQRAVARVRGDTAASHDGRSPAPRCPA